MYVCKALYLVHSCANDRSVHYRLIGTEGNLMEKNSNNLKKRKKKDDILQKLESEQLYLKIIAPYDEAEKLTKGPRVTTSHEKQF